MSTSSNPPPKNTSSDESKKTSSDEPTKTEHPGDLLSHCRGWKFLGDVTVGWTREDYEKLVPALKTYPAGHVPNRWPKIAAIVGTKDAEQCENYYHFMLDDPNKFEDGLVAFPDYIEPDSHSTGSGGEPEVTSKPVDPSSD